MGLDTTNDPAAVMFTTANFAGASGAQLADARALYAILTGRVVAVTGQATLDAETNKYSFLGTERNAGKMDLYSRHAQDTWRLTPTVTLSAGVRWDVQMPFSPVNSTMTTASLADICGVSGLGSGGIFDACNFLRSRIEWRQSAGLLAVPKGSLGYNTDWNNIAPNIGIAWRPQIEDGWLRRLLGDPEQATIPRRLFGRARPAGPGRVHGCLRRQPGRRAQPDAGRQHRTGAARRSLARPALRDTSRLFPAPFAETPVFPIALRPNRADNINAFHPDTKIASARTWTVGVQRAVTKDMAVEVRYVGTRGVDQWSELNYNERNRLENGFQDEFIRAMNNLTANNLAGGARAGSFAYFGAGTGTSPLPIYPRLPEREPRRRQSERVHGRHQHLDQHRHHPGSRAAKSQPGELGD